jgi:hypothetical protein
MKLGHQCADGLQRPTDLSTGPYTFWPPGHGALSKTYPFATGCLVAADYNAYSDDHHPNDMIG